jgi:LysM repeat protein
LGPLALIVVLVAFLAIVTSSGDSGGSSSSSDESATTTSTETSTTTKAATKAKVKAKKKAAGATYTVQVGDTLGGIADKTGVPLERIEELNPNVDPHSMNAGQEIKLK